MKNENMKDKLARVGELAGSVDALERDLALQILREVYSELKFVAGTPVVDSTVREEPAPESEQEQVLEPEKEPEPEPEKESEPLPDPEPAPKEEELPARRRRVAPEVIRSLYGDTPVEKLGDVISPGHQTLGETLRGGKKDMASRLAAAERSDLKSAIGINDKFLMVRDMFDGDTKAFNDTIALLDTFADLDEAIIYIHDNYNWSADSDGVKLLVDLLERKLG